MLHAHPPPQQLLIIRRLHLRLQGVLFFDQWKCFVYCVFIQTPDFYWFFYLVWLLDRFYMVPLFQTNRNTRLQIVLQLLDHISCPFFRPIEMFLEQQKRLLHPLFFVLLCFNRSIPFFFFFFKTKYFQMIMFAFAQCSFLDLRFKTLIYMCKLLTICCFLQSFFLFFLHIKSNRFFYQALAAFLLKNELVLTVNHLCIVANFFKCNFFK